MFCDGQMFLMRCSVSKMHSWPGFITVLRTIIVLLYFAYLIFSFSEKTGMFLFVEN